MPIVIMCTDSDFAKAVRENQTVRGTLDALGIMSKQTTTYKYVYDRVKKQGLSTVHWVGVKFERPKGTNRTIPQEDVLTQGSKYSTSLAKKKIISGGLLPYNCAMCGVDKWNNQPLTLELDHINGVNNDHRIENLRFICPNCHSQTDTYCGRNTAWRKVRTESAPKSDHTSENTCVDCGDPVSRKSTRCQVCAGVYTHPTKIQWPDGPTLLHMVQATSKLAVAKRLGVSDAAVVNHLEANGIFLPKRKYNRHQSLS